MTAAPYHRTSASPELEIIQDRLAAENPFLDNRSNGPGPRLVDVSTIHQQAFARLTELARQSATIPRGIGALLCGAAGTGKSHVLSRLASWARQDGQAMFVYLHNLQAPPEQMPRALLQGVLHSLVEGRTRHLAGTPLFDLVHRAILQAGERNLSQQPWHVLLQRFVAQVDQVEIHERAGTGYVDRRIYAVLFRLYRSSYRASQGREDGTEAALAARWLAGSSLDREEGRRLGLQPARHHDDGITLEGAQQIKEVLVALSRLAALARRPFLLLLDQVDNLEDDQAAALARFLQALLDSAASLLVVTAGVQATLLEWRERGVIQESAWDRLAQVETRLLRLSNEEAQQIIRSRLESFWHQLAAWEPLASRRQEDPLFPLGRRWMEEQLADRNDIRPRDAIRWACEGWRREQQELARAGLIQWLEDWPARASAGQQVTTRPKASEPSVEEKLLARLEELRGQLQTPQALPADGDHLASLVYSLLTQLRSVDGTGPLLNVSRVPAPRPGARPAYDLSLQLRTASNGQVVTTGVLMLTATTATSATGFLRRLCEDPRPLDSLVLVTDARVGLPLGAQGRRYLEQLAGAAKPALVRYELGASEYGELEAMGRLVGLARSGDLEITDELGASRSLAATEVIEVLNRAGCYGRSSLLATLLRVPGSAK